MWRRSDELEPCAESRRVHLQRLWVRVSLDSRTKTYFVSSRCQRPVDDAIQGTWSSFAFGFWLIQWKMPPCMLLSCLVDDMTKTCEIRFLSPIGSWTNHSPIIFSSTRRSQIWFQAEGSFFKAFICFRLCWARKMLDNWCQAADLSMFTRTSGRFERLRLYCSELLI